MMVSETKNVFFVICLITQMMARTTAVNSRIVIVACHPKAIPTRVPASGKALPDAVMGFFRLLKYWMMLAKNQPIRPPATQVTIGSMDGGIALTRSVGR